MPAASVCDSVTIAIQRSFESSKNVDDSTITLAGSSSRILQSEVEYEETGDYRSTILDRLKSKYIVLNLPSDEKSETKKVTDNVVKTKKTENTISKPTLPEPAFTLYPAQKVRLGWKEDYPVGAGMFNVGNTCYLNSTLQALFHIPALVNWLLYDSHHNSKCEQSDGGGECLTCAMAKTLQFSHQKSGESIKPFYIYNKLKLICRTMVPGQQEDAHEFLRYLLEGMERAYLARNRATKLDSYSKETTPINQIFGGYIRTEVKCLQCRHVSTTFQHFQDLLVDIRKASTLDEALASYFSQEQLDNNDYKCEACKRRVPATKQFTLEKPPKVLCVQLKRFSVLGGKIQRHIGFKQTIDMGPYLWKEAGEPRKKLTYKLMSMVTHMGSSVNCGHYTAIAQVSSGKYYSFDDSCVRPTSLNNVLNTNAYIMIFEMEPQTDIQFQNQQSPKINGTIQSKRLLSLANNSSNKHPTQKQTSLSNFSSNSFTKSKSFSEEVSAVSQKSSSPRRNSNFIGPQLPSNKQLCSQHSNTENGKPSNGSSLVPYDGSSEEEESSCSLLNNIATLETSLISKSAQSSSNNSCNNIQKSLSVLSKEESPRVVFSKDSLKSSKLAKLGESKLPSENGITHRWEKLQQSGTTSISNGSTSNGSKQQNGRTESNEKTENINGKDRWNNQNKTKNHEEKIVTKASSSMKGWHISPHMPSLTSSSTSNGWSVTDNKDESKKPNNYASTVHAAAARTFDGTNRSETADRLTKMTHRGYGDSSVVSWDGNKTHLGREIDNETHQERKRHFDDDAELDKGRVKKPKNNYHKNFNGRLPHSGHNPFQEFQNKSWNRRNTFGRNDNYYRVSNNYRQHRSNGFGRFYRQKSHHSWTHR